METCCLETERLKILMGEVETKRGYLSRGFELRQDSSVNSLRLIEIQNVRIESR